MTQAKVTFEPGGQMVEVPRGALISEAARRAKVVLATPCDGKGLCGQCRVIVKSGRAGALTETEGQHLSREQLKDGLRLACQAVVLEDVVVEVLAIAQITAQKSLTAEMVRPVAVDPSIRRHWLRLDPPSLEDQRSDFRRIADAVCGSCPELTAGPAVLVELPAIVRDSDYEVVITRRGGELIDVHPSAEAPRCLGAAVDIGTSTVAVYVLDLETGRQLAEAAGSNSQSQYGLDVISRIEYAGTNSDGLARLRGEVVQLVNSLISEALRQIDGDPHEVLEATVVGNTCMHHLFLGLDPRYLAQAPYVPVTADAVNLSPTEVGLDIHPRVNIFCLPCIAGFVGADTVGVIAANEMTRRDKAVLAVDIGTNGEIALWSGEALLVASCAAGPAFEGAQIQQGVRATPGAIDRVFSSNDQI